MALGAAQQWLNNSGSLLTVSGSVNNGGFLLTLAGSGATTLSGGLSGNGGLSRVGSGVTTLSAASAYSGATTINGGTLQVGVVNALPTATALTLSNSAGAVLNLNGNNQTIGSLVGGGAGGGNVALAGGTLTVGNANSTTYSGIISGNGGLTKQGAGMLTLNAAQSYSGATIVSGGTLQLQPNFASGLFSTAAMAYTFASGTAANIGTLSVNTSTSGSPTFSASGGPKPGLGYVTLNGSQYIEIDPNPTSGTLTNLGGTSGISYTIGMWINTSTQGGEYLYKGASSGWSAERRVVLPDLSQRQYRRRHGHARGRRPMGRRLRRRQYQRGQRELELYFHRAQRRHRHVLCQRRPGRDRHEHEPRRAGDPDGPHWLVADQRK